MRKPIYHAFRAANVEEALAAEAAASIPDDVVSREEFLEAVNRSETKLDELKDAVAENKIAIAEAAAKNEAAIAKSTEENRVAIAEMATKIAKSTEENKVAIAEMAAEIAKSTGENKVAIAEMAAEIAKSTGENKAANSSLKVEMIRWMLAINATSAGIILGVLKLL